LEDVGGLLKGDFDTAQVLINDCRKNGKLPVAICAEDQSRLPDNAEELDEPDPREEAAKAIRIIQNWHSSWKPISFWEYQDYFIYMVVEKIDLKSLFSVVCEEYHVEIINAKGWSDINSRVRMAKLFRKWEKKGKICVLLYCGDRDPGGLNILDFIQEKFRQLQGATGWNPDGLIIDRFGLNKDFIKLNELTWIENLHTSSGGDLGDPKHQDNAKTYVQDYIALHGRRKCEANSLVVRPEEGRKRCLDFILKYISAEGVEQYEADMEERRAGLKIEIDRQLKRLLRN
jgi:hypothetical protein